ncbi:MAG: hypothetical protein CSB13_00230 [Chloroflexi bacterium]|nr:MAG: hypothetical protein CSB13_00230 [Chloroflexota bacterium]
MTNTRISFSRLRYGIGTKITIPFLLLTLFIAAAGTFLVTTFITDSLNERLTNRLVDAGRVVSRQLVAFEEERLNTLRLISATQGVPQALAEKDKDTLEDLVLPLTTNESADAIEIVDMEGIEIFGWQRIPAAPLSEAITKSGSDFSTIDGVRFALEGVPDALGDKAAFLSHTDEGEHILFTVGPVRQSDGEIVGAAMVGTFLHPMAIKLTENAIARVTFYDKNGLVIDTTLSSSDETYPINIPQNTNELEIIREQLQISQESYEIVRTTASRETPIADVSVLGQEYSLAYGDWRLRNQSFGLFSVALPTDFVPKVRNTGRNSFLLLFLGTSLTVLIIGLLLARSITKPLSQLVNTATAVGEGDLNKRTGIKSKDEIGKLATSFDLMTGKLSQRNEELLKQTTELETILNNITDGVLLLDEHSHIITANAAAQKLLADLSYDFQNEGLFRELQITEPDTQTAVTLKSASPLLSDNPPAAKRYQIGERTVMALTSELESDEGLHLGTVVVMRDITSEIESENLKGAFITNISHELRTPLTVIKVYGELLQKTGNGHLDERQIQFVRNINRSTTQLENHINQLINISEIEAGLTEADFEPIDFAELVHTSSEYWQDRFQAKEINFSVHLPDTPLIVLADTTQLGWAVGSLFSNAHNYTANGGKVSVYVSQMGHQAQLEVIDSGIGIAASDQPLLFSRFFRAQNSLNYETRGVGLGLYIAKSVVTAHHGEIRVESDLGKGSTFSIILPLVHIHE